MKLNLHQLFHPEIEKKIKIKLIKTHSILSHLDYFHNRYLRHMPSAAGYKYSCHMCTGGWDMCMPSSRNEQLKWKKKSIQWWWQVAKDRNQHFQSYCDNNLNTQNYTYTCTWHIYKLNINVSRVTRFSYRTWSYILLMTCKPVL